MEEDLTGAMTFGRKADSAKDAKEFQEAALHHLMSAEKFMRAGQHAPDAETRHALAVLAEDQQALARRRQLDSRRALAAIPSNTVILDTYFDKTQATPSSATPASASASVPTPTSTPSQSTVPPTLPATRDLDAAVSNVLALEASLPPPPQPPPRTSSRGNIDPDLFNPFGTAGTTDDLVSSVLSAPGERMHVGQAPPPPPPREPTVSDEATRLLDVIDLLTKENAARLEEREHYAKLRDREHRLDNRAAELRREYETKLKVLRSAMGEFKTRCLETAARHVEHVSKVSKVSKVVATATDEGGDDDEKGFPLSALLGYVDALFPPPVTAAPNVAVEGGEPTPLYRASSTIRRLATQLIAARAQAVEDAATIAELRASLAGADGNK